MIFTLKKLFQAFFLPPTLIFILLFISLLLIIFRKKWGKILLFISIMLYYLLSIAPISDSLIRKLEDKHRFINIPRADVKYVVVLGHDTRNPNSLLPATNRLSPPSMARTLEGIRLYSKINDAYLVLSGGSGGIFFQKEKPCILMKKLALLFGVEEERIILESSSRDTYEEAKEIKKILGDKRFLLVTSAYHMPRSIYIFKKLGLNAIAAPCDFRTRGERKYDFFAYLPFSLENSTKAIREYIGLLYYRFLK
jgi:uncharacterized SAM-binding protein YcdF (DUF218 family)